MADAPHPGSVAWFDLTVKDADSIRDFYAHVVGWNPEPLSMGSYSDYVMKVAGTDEAACGICHARGTNADLPAQWLVYAHVADLEVSMTACRTSGGKVLAGPKSMGDGARYCVIQDPAGAVLALYQAAR